MADESLKVFKSMNDLKQNNASNMIEVAHYLTEMVKSLKKKIQKTKKSEENFKKTTDIFAAKLKSLTIRLRQNQDFLKKLENSTHLPYPLNQNLEYLIHQNEFFFNPKGQIDLSSISLNFTKEMNFLKESTTFCNTQKSGFKEDLELSEIVGIEDESFITRHEVEDEGLTLENSIEILDEDSKLQLESAKHDIKEVKELLINLLETQENLNIEDFSEFNPIEEKRPSMEESGSLERERVLETKRSQIVTTLEDLDEKLNESLNKMDVSFQKERKKISTTKKIAKGILSFFSQGMEALVPGVEAYNMDPTQL